MMPGPASAIAANWRLMLASSGGSRGAAAASPAMGRSSAPWPPIAGSCKGEKIRSISLTGRPLTKASAPPARCHRRPSVSRREWGTNTSRGVGAMSRIVPSISSRMASRVRFSLGTLASGMVARSLMLAARLQRHPAVDEVSLSGNVACLVGCEEHGKRRHFLGTAQAPHRLAPDERALDIRNRPSGGLSERFDAPLERGRLDRARTYGVGPDAALDEIRGDRFREP